MLNQKHVSVFVVLGLLAIEQVGLENDITRRVAWLADSTVLRAIWLNFWTAIVFRQDGKHLCPMGHGCCGILMCLASTNSTTEKMGATQELDKSNI